MLSRTCGWTGCEYSAPFGPHCYFHDKVARGIFNERMPVNVTDERSGRGIYVSRTSGEQRTGALASAVIDDEQRELADLLEVMGVEGKVVKGAVTRGSAASALDRS